MLNAKAVIIFQGPITNSLQDGLRASIVAIKKENPEIAIWISTWESCDVPYLGHDKTIKHNELDNFTPLGYKANNLHRQILTTHESMRILENAIVAKLRTDIIISNPKLLIKELFRVRDDGKIFGKKITTISYSSVDPLRNDMPLLYHPCDWVYIGRSDDLNNLFDCPIPDQNYFTEGLSRVGKNPRLGNYAEGMRSEEYICSYSLNKSHWRGRGANINPSLFSKIRSNRKIASDFYVVDIGDIGLTSVKHKTNLFNPNRFTKFAINIWSRGYDEKYLFLRCRTVLKIYYSQKYFFQMLRWLKKLLKALLNQRF